MNPIATMPVQNHGKTVAYIVPVDDFNRYKELEELEKLENQELAGIAKTSMESGFASDEETDSLFADILGAGK